MTESAELELLRSRVDDANALAARTNKASVLVVQQFPVPEPRRPLCPPVRESIANVLTFVELGTAADLQVVLDTCGTMFDVVALDCDQKLPESPAIVAAGRSRVPAHRLMLFSDNQAWFDSALDMVQRIEGGVTGRAVALCGSGPLFDLFALTLPRLGATLVRGPAPESAGDVQIVIGASQKQASIGEALVAALPDAAAIYDVGIANLAGAAAARARERGLRLYRLDNRAGISSAIVRLLETDYMVSRLMGHLRVRDVDIVAGGLLAPEGAVIVDDIRTPTFVFGVADGEGRFKPAPLSADDQRRLDFVRSLTVTVGS